YFRFDHNRDFFVWQEAGDPFVKIGHFRFGISIVETEHWRAVLDFGESLKRLAADALRGRIRGNQIGKLRFKIDKLLVKPVIFMIADDGSSFLVVEPVMLPDSSAQLLNALYGFLLFHGHPRTIQTREISAIAVHLAKRTACHSWCET